MNLKLIKPQHRITFLASLTRELLDNSIEKEKINQKVEVEKLRQKLVEPKQTKEIFQPSIFPRPVYPQEARKPIFHRIPIKLKPKLIRPTQQKPIPTKVPQKVKDLVSSIKPVARQRPEGFVLGKLEPFLKDKGVQSIECPGPGKNILVKRYNKINLTKVILNQAEITDVINTFSEQAKIPITGGILKAAVGDMVVSAVISEFIGSRFIINKISPYNLIEQK